eukprot:78388_1
METSFLMHNFELIEINEYEISVDDVLNTHQQLLDNECNTNNKTLELIDAMGGMDIVLTNYVRNNTLNNHTLSQINNILIAINREHNKSSNTAESNAILYVSRSNTYLHDIFNSYISVKIIQILYSTTTSIVMASTLLMYSIIGFVLPYAVRNTTIIDNIQGICSVCFYILAIVWIMYESFVLLSLNKILTKKILTTFEFWFKLLYFIRTCICFQFEYITFNVEEAVLNLSAILFILVYSFIDALQISNTYKRVVMVGGAIVFT